MANFVVCKEKQTTYLDIRGAMINGARTVEEVRAATGICASCDGCVTHLQWILDTVCRCRAVPTQAIINAAKNGVDTVDGIGKLLQAGTEETCGRCKPLIENIVKTKR